MVQKATAKALAALGDAIKQASISVAEGGLPILSPGTVLEVTTKDVNNSHPYTATTLGQKIGTNNQWVSTAARKLGLRESQKFSVGILGSKGQIALWKYSEEGLRALQAQLDSDPSFDPYH